MMKTVEVVLVASILWGNATLGAQSRLGDGGQGVVYQGHEGPGVGKHVVLLAGDWEYRSEESLPMLAKILAERHGFKCTLLFPINPKDGILYEGGVRVPFIVQWPGTVGAGKTSDAVVSHLDIVPTCMAAAGGKLPADRDYDGSDLRDCFAGNAGDWTKRPMFWRVWRDRAVRMGKWKLVWTGDAPARLYDLATDIEEEKDLAAGHPAIVGNMKEAWKAWNKKNIAPLFQFEIKGGPWKGND